MKDNRNKWSFINIFTKPALTASEVRYWKATMFKLLKVGIEFEFNLPTQSGTCRGNNVTCGCTYINNGCWEVCENIEKCEHTPCIDTCKNVTNKCKEEDCATCNNYVFKCLGTNCTGFVSVCINKCTNFKIDCDGCPKKYNPIKDPSVIRNNLVKILKPTNDYTKHNSSGVVSVTKDGSLEGDGGVEIITVGRRVDYWEFYEMTDKILKEVTKKGGSLNERCGSHMHILTTYYDSKNSAEKTYSASNELEKNVPEIIVANFHQLCRRYQNAITWMTMALNDPNHMTRWEKFRVSILDISPVQQDIRSLAKAVSYKTGHKYGWVNYNQMQFDKNTGEASTFHIEMRVADSTMCPSYYAALACLYVAFVIKAVEISRYGLLKVADENGEWLSKADEAKKAILNNTGDYKGSRLGNTTNAMHFKEQYIKEGMDMLSQLKGILMRIGPAYSVLEKLIQKPPALRRCEGDSWKQIEKDIAVVTEASVKLENKLQEVIDLGLLQECNSIKEWVKEVTKLIREEWSDEVGDITETDIENFTNTKIRDGLVIWSESAGGMLNI